MEPIKIELVENAQDGRNGWTVTQGDKSADWLGYDEMLGLVAALTMPDERPAIHWMKTKEQRDAYIRSIS